MSTLAEILLASLMLVGLWWLYFVGYPSLVLDNTRQRLFRIRDALFEEAEAGNIPFDSKAYTMLRTTLNGMIQYAHVLGPLQFAISQLGEKLYGPARGGDQFAEEFEAAVCELPETGQEIVIDASRRMHITVVKHLIYRSVLLTLIFICLRALVRSRRMLLDTWVKKKETDHTMYELDFRAASLVSRKDKDFAVC